MVGLLTGAFSFDVAAMIAAPFAMGSLVYLRSPLGECGTLRFTNGTGAALAAGTIILHNNKVGIVLETTANAADGVLIVRTDSQGYLAPKAAVTIAEGEAAYWDDTAKVVTNVETENTKIGYFAESAASGTARVRTVFE